jgi:hypothetical protein
MHTIQNMGHSSYQRRLGVYGLDIYLYVVVHYIKVTFEVSRDTSLHYIQNIR